MDVVYAALHRIAKGHLRKERSDHTLQPTALVNEAHLKLFGHSEIQFVDRAHFFAVVSQAMRRVLVDHARIRGAVHRGSDGERVPLSTTIEVEASAGKGQMGILELDLALDALAQEKS